MMKIRSGFASSEASAGSGPERLADREASWVGHEASWVDHEADCVDREARRVAGEAIRVMGQARTAIGARPPSRRPRGQALAVTHNSRACGLCLRRRHALARVFVLMSSWLRAAVFRFALLAVLACGRLGRGLVLRRAAI